MTGGESSRVKVQHVHFRHLSLGHLLFALSLSAGICKFLHLHVYVLAVYSSQSHK